MNAFADWMVRRGLDPAEMRRRALGGVVIGVTVVLIDRMIGFGS